MRVEVELSSREDGSLPDGTSALRISCPDLGIRQYLYLPYSDFHRLFHAPEDTAADLLVVAGICYVVDQTVSRSLFPDCWTRYLEVSVPVRDPNLWGLLSDQIAEMLSFLTGDVWSLSFSRRDEPLYRQRHRHLRRERLYRASAVALFSGGLDSLVGAIDRCSESDEVLTLAGHYDLGSTAPDSQLALAEALKRHFPGRVNFFQERIGALQAGAGVSRVYRQVTRPPHRESTFRSRSFLFLALGTYFAVHHIWNSVTPLLIPENGLIALNPPLTESRLGSCSTRTTHPLFLDQYRALVQALDLNLSISNPLFSKTKGEVLAQCTDRALLQELLPHTISCAHPTRRQGWERRNARNCGYCVPCLFRRAALHTIGMDRGQDYGIDALGGELDLKQDIASDFRAVVNWVDSIRGEGQAELAVRRMPIAVDHYPVALHLLKTGCSEMIRLLTDRATHGIQRWAAIT